MVDIRVQMSSDSIWGNDPSATVGLDVAASEEHLLEMVRTQVQIDYPNAIVDVEMTLNESVEVDGTADSFGAQAIEETVHQVWAGWEWIVARTVRPGDRVEEKSKCGCQAMWRVEHVIEDIVHLECVTATTCAVCIQNGRIFGRYGWTCRMPLYEIKPTDAGDAEWRMM